MRSAVHQHGNDHADATLYWSSRAADARLLVRTSLSGLTDLAREQVEFSRRRSAGLLKTWYNARRSTQGDTGTLAGAMAAGETWEHDHGASACSAHGLRLRSAA